MFAVLGATGQVGSAVLRTLASKGLPIRAISRNARNAEALKAMGAEIVVADAYDADALAVAFAGVDGAFVMNPPSYASPDMFADAERVAAAIGQASVTVGLPKLVCLSSVGAHRTERQGNIRTTRILEQALSALSIPTAFVRAAWFMENWSGTIAVAKEKGVVPSFLHPLDRAIPMVGTADIGRVCAEVLIQSWSGRRVVELEGPSDLAPTDVAAAISSLLANPVRAIAAPREGWASFFESKGNSRAAALAWVEMIDGFNEGWMTFEGGHERQRGTVDLRGALNPRAAATPVVAQSD